MNPLDNENHPYFRFAHDIWYFGMLLISGEIIGFESIDEI